MAGRRGKSRARGLVGGKLVKGKGLRRGFGASAIAQPGGEGRGETRVRPRLVPCPRLPLALRYAQRSTPERRCPRSPWGPWDAPVADRFRRAAGAEATR